MKDKKKKVEFVFEKIGLEENKVNRIKIQNEGKTLQRDVKELKESIYGVR